MSSKFNELIYLVESLQPNKEDSTESTSSGPAEEIRQRPRYKHNWDYQDEVDISGIIYTIEVTLEYPSHDIREFVIDEMQAIYDGADGKPYLETRPEALKQIKNIIENIIAEDDDFWHKKQKEYY